MKPFYLFIFVEFLINFNLLKKKKLHLPLLIWILVTRIQKL
jgi:hypothetical protein